MMEDGIKKRMCEYMYIYMYVCIVGSLSCTEEIEETL